MHVSQLITQEYYMKFTECINTLRQNGTVQGESVTIRKDGTSFHADIHGTILYFQNRPHMLAIIHDISTRKETDTDIRELNAELVEHLKKRSAELEATNRELRDFIYAASHDLKTPLHGGLLFLFFNQN